MAMVMENQQPVQLVVPAAPSPPPPPPPPLPPRPVYKHRCKVCKKGFVCGRALGGHMRAHGVADDVLSEEDDDVLDDEGACPCSGDTGGSSPSASSSKRMYALRTNPGRLKSCRVCENCGKEFTSWKSLLDHGRCNNEQDEEDDDDDDGEEVVDLALAGGWSKGKRTRRANKVMVVETGSVTQVQSPTHPSSEEEDLANCLVMLSSSQPPAVVDDQEPCASASKMYVERNSSCRVLVPQPISVMAPATRELKLLAPPQVVPQPVSITVPRGLFECKGCKKVFTSHQALGGHRASHKKVKGCFAAKLESNRSTTDPPQAVTATTPAGVANSSVVSMASAAREIVAATKVDEAPAPPSSVSPTTKKKGKVHECSICHRVFTSGQALGGHKRCHWLTAGGSRDIPSAGAVVANKLYHTIVPQDQYHTLQGRPTFGAADPVLGLLNAPTEQAAELSGSVLCLNAPASLYMQSWTTGHSNASIANNKTATSSRNDAAATTEDEADSRSAKRGKISDLRDMNVAGETSPWLQVGIGLPSDETKALKSTRE